MKPNSHFGSPGMTQAEIRAFMENKMREEFGPEAELMIQVARITQQFLADQEVARVQPKVSEK